MYYRWLIGNTLAHLRGGGEQDEGVRIQVRMHACMHGGGGEQATACTASALLALRPRVDSRKHCVVQSLGVAFVRWKALEAEVKVLHGSTPCSLRLTLTHPLWHGTDSHGSTSTLLGSACSTWVLFKAAAERSHAPAARLAGWLRRRCLACWSVRWRACGTTTWPLSPPPSGHCSHWRACWRHR